jgi:hypothetical protein
LLLGYHELLTVDHDGRVTTVVRAIGRYWWGTDPNKPSPRIEHTRLQPSYPAGLQTGSILEGTVRAQLSHADGFPASQARAIERVLDELIGSDRPEARAASRPVLVTIAELMIAEDREQQKRLAVEEGR